MNILASRGYVKKRSVKKEAVYELLPAGEYLAHKLLADHPHLQNSGQQAAGGHWSLSNRLIVLQGEEILVFDELF